MFGWGRKVNVTPYDREKREPVIRSSICTGEKVAGFRDRETGRFEEVMLIRTEKDLDEFMEKYAVDRADLKQVW